MARQLVTIGDLTRAQPLSRSRTRRQRMGLGWIGSATADTGGPALQDAALALLNHLDAAGVTPESRADAEVSVFQAAWNADPANSGDQLVVDGKYGPLTKGALDAMTGGIAPAVNGGAAPAPAPPAPAPAPAPAPHVVPSPAAPSSSGSSELVFWLFVAAAAVGGYLLLRKKKKGGLRRGRSAPLVEVRSNPRRLMRRRNAELIP